ARSYVSPVHGAYRVNGGRAPAAISTETNGMWRSPTAPCTSSFAIAKRITGSSMRSWIDYGKLHHGGHGGTEVHGGRTWIAPHASRFRDGRCCLGACIPSVPQCLCGIVLFYLVLRTFFAQPRTGRGDH